MAVSKFIPVSSYEQIVKLKKISPSVALGGRRKCITCKRPFNKGDFFIGNSRRRFFICRVCAIPFLSAGIAEADVLKKMFEERIADLESNKDAYDKEEMLNDL